MQRGNDLVAGCRETLANFKHHILVIVALALVVSIEGKSFNGLDPLSIGLVVAPVGGDYGIDVLEVGQTHRCADLDHLAVGSRVDHVVEAGKSEVAHQAHLVGQRIVVGNDGPAFKGVEKLGGVKAQHFAGAKIADHRAAQAAAEGMGRVVHQLELELVGDGLQFGMCCTPAPQMNANDARGMRRDHAPDGVRIERMGHRIDICEDRRYLLPVQGVGRGDEGIGWDDDLALQFEGADGDFEGYGAVAHGNAMLDAKIVRDLGFEFLDERPVIGQPAAIEHLLSTPHEAFAFANVWPADMQLSLKCGGGAVNGQVLLRSNLFHVSTPSQDVVRYRVNARGMIHRHDTPPIYQSTCNRLGIHMPEQLRALLVIVALALIIFAFVKRAFAETIAPTNFNRWKNLWFTLTFAAFLSHSFWLYALVAAFVLVATAKQSDNIVALYFAALFAVPAAGLQIPGLGLINYLISLNHLRILSLFLLLPAFFALRPGQGTVAFGRLWPDRLLILYALLVVALQLRSTTLTDTIRQGVYVLLDVLLPYYVVSRALRSVDSFKQAMAAFLLACALLVGFALFESIRHWNLYSAVVPALDPQMGFGSYLGREGILRASASTGHSIALGYVMAVAAGLYLYWQHFVLGKFMRRIGWLGLLAGLIAPLSRGPWVGMAVIVVIFVATGREASKKLFLIAMSGLVALPLLALLPGGQRILDFLPFVGNVESANIDYRERLIDNGLIVIQRNPLLGSTDFRSTQEMEEMRQGQGIIDIVNTYIGVTLEYGLVGLSVFVGFFLSVLWGIRKEMRSFSGPDEEMARLGRALFATIVGIMVIIFTVSSITVIPIVYWSMAGLGVAYIQMAREHRKAMGANRAD